MDNPRILIIDDDPGLRKTLADRLFGGKTRDFLHSFVPVQDFPVPIDKIQSVRKIINNPSKRVTAKIHGASYCRFFLTRMIFYSVYGYPFQLYHTFYNRLSSFSKTRRQAHISSELC